MKTDYKNINTTSLPHDVAEVFSIIKTDTENFTNELAIKAHSENLDKLMELINDKFPEAVKNNTEPEKIDNTVYPHPILKVLKQAYDKAEDDFRKNMIVYDTALSLGGDSKKSLRQEIMTAIKGEKIPIAKCGVHAIEAEFKKFLEKSEQPSVEPVTQTEQKPVAANQKIKSKIEVFKMMLEMAETEAEKQKIENKIEVFEMMLETDTDHDNVVRVLKKGDVVVHDRFGEGEVLKIEGEKATIDFTSGEKSLIIKFAGLEYRDGTKVYTNTEEKKHEPLIKEIPKKIIVKKSRGQKKRESDRKALEKYNNLSNQEKIKSRILSINGLVKGDRQGSFKILLADLLGEIEDMAQKKNDEKVLSIVKSIDKYMSASEKQAFVVSKFADENGIKIN